MRLVIDATGTTPGIAAEVVLDIATRKKPRNLPGLVQKLIQEGDLAGWMRIAEESLRVSAGQARASLGACPHDVPGGLEPLPSTGLPFCPLCRKGLAS